MHPPAFLFLLILGTLALSSAPCGAQSDPPVNSIRAGATSLQFLTFGGAYRGPAFSTSGIYLKRHFSDRGALRLGTDFRIDESSGEAVGSQDFSNERYYSVSVTAEIQDYIDASGSVTSYVGLGPYWTRGRSSYTRSDTQTYQGVSYAYYHKNEVRYWEVGGAAAAGFEWFFRSRLSLIGRVGASVGFGRRHQVEDTVVTDPNFPLDEVRRFESDTAQAGATTAALGLGLYF